MLAVLSGGRHGPGLAGEQTGRARLCVGVGKQAVTACVLEPVVSGTACGLQV